MDKRLAQSNAAVYVSHSTFHKRNPSLPFIASALPVDPRRISVAVTRAANGVIPGFSHVITPSPPVFSNTLLVVSLSWRDSISLGKELRGPLRPDTDPLDFRRQRMEALCDGISRRFGESL
jgi:hypothetical protein